MQTLETEYTIYTHDADAFGLWRPDAIFRLMQELAGAHSEQLGFSRDALLRSRGCVWMLARVHARVLRYPRLHDRLRAKTWYGPPGRITYPRYVLISDDSGAEVAALATSWIVVETQSRRILLPGKAQLVFPPPADLAPPLPEPGRLRMAKEGLGNGPEAILPETTLRAPHYSDLDVNGHMNNASYVSWILDLFPMSWHSEHRVSDLVISYSAEATPGEEVALSLYRGGQRFELLGEDRQDGHTVFEAQGAFAAFQE